MNDESYRPGCIFFLRECFFNRWKSPSDLICHARSGLINFWRNTDMCKCKLVLTIHVKVMLMLKSYSVQTRINMITEE